MYNNVSRQLLSSPQSFPPMTVSKTYDEYSKNVVYHFCA